MHKETQHTSLKRRLTGAQISMIALSGALGTGLFLGSGSTIAFAGPATVISYALAGVIALSVVWALAEMVSVYPVPGGHGAIAAVFLGKMGGYVTRWNFVVTYLFAVGAEVVATATYLQHWFVNLPLAVGTVLCSAFIITLNLATVRLYGISEYWFSMVKVIAIAVFILLGFSVILWGWPADHGSLGLTNFTSHGGFMPKGVTGIFLATCMAVFSFGGIENVSLAAAESQHPQRDIPRAAGTMIWRLLIFYVFAVSIVIGLQPWTQTVKDAGNAEASPFVKVLDDIGIAGAGHVMNGILIIAALSAANGCLYAASRAIHSLALDGMAPKFASRTSHQGSPHGAVALATVCFVTASALAIWSPNNAFMVLYGCATVGILLTWILVMLTHMRFRAKEKAQNSPRPPAYLWGAPVVNIAVIIATVAIFCGLRGLMPVSWTAGIPYMILLFGSFPILNKVRSLPYPSSVAEILRLEKLRSQTGRTAEKEKSK